MVSIIVPVLNEEKNISHLANNLFSLHGNYEIIFVDGGSTDNTVSCLNELITNISFTVIVSSRGRAKQMNAGAKIAKGEILLFLHGDSLLDENSILSIQDSINNGYEAGVFTLYFYDYQNVSLKLIALFSNLRSRLLSLYFGDQGIFVKKQLFFMLNMYPDIPIMEDYQFSSALKSSKKIVLSTKIGTSARRFINGGIWKTIFLMQKIKYLFHKGISPEKLSSLYRQSR